MFRLKNISKRLRSLFLAFIGLVLAFTSSCSNAETGPSQVDKPLDLIPKDSLVALLVDLHLTDATSKQNFIPNNNDTYYEYQEYKAILNFHKISRNRFDATLRYYCAKGNDFEKLYEEVIAELQARESKNKATAEE